jgi:glycosyltransferase involved in cell wall biosynthesis
MGIKVAHVIQSISPIVGGPPNVVLHLAAAQASLGAEVKIVTYADSRNECWWSSWGKINPRLCQVKLQEIRRSAIPSRSEMRAVRGLYESVDIMHIHGIWVSLGCYALLGRRRGGAAALLAAHGTLSPWALSQRSLKKKLAMRAGLRGLISLADAFHAVSIGERNEIKAAVSTARTVIIPNGVDMGELSSRSSGEMEAEVANQRAAGYVLFLARLHEVKGADLLVEAFALLLKNSTECSSYKLILAGPDYGEEGSLRAQAKRLCIDHKIEFPGAVFGDVKRDLFQNAALVCQPSRYEAFSLTLLEALAAGVPVLTTFGSNFPEIATAEAGIVCGRTPEELARNMQLLLTRPALRVQMGNQGRDLVQRKYTWECIAAHSLEIYADIQTGGGIADQDY